ncbi:hypothetical protein BH24CHL4_BH24CHL4_08260 [soil metagenome]
MIAPAGQVLAATVAVLGVLPLVPRTELRFLVAFGVLLDTLIVRLILAPALTFDFCSKVWWPSSLWSQERAGSQVASARQRPTTAD